MPEMEVGLVGLPGSGKTTLFAALTGSVPEHAGAMRPNLGIASVPDPRLAVIARYITTKAIVPATLQVVDIPGVPLGSGAEKLNSFLSHVRQVDALCHVVRCFDDGTGVHPVHDINDMDTELVLADLVVVEGARERAARATRGGDRDAALRHEVLEKAAELLNDGRPVRVRDDWSDAEQIVIRTFGLISAKPVLYVANLDEHDLGSESAAVTEVSRHAEAAGAEAVAICARVEAEIQELEESDRAEMLESMGLTEPAVGALARGLNHLLGLGVFYTAGPKQVRAWPVRRGSTAPEAAGAIHSDMERGFIRAECYHVDDLVRHESEKAIREAGKLRSEGKGYRLQDGDVVHFLFNV